MDLQLLAVRVAASAAVGASAAAQVCLQVQRLDRNCTSDLSLLVISGSFLTDACVCRGAEEQRLMNLRAKPCYDCVAPEAERLLSDW